MRAKKIWGIPLLLLTATITLPSAAHPGSALSLQHYDEQIRQDSRASRPRLSRALILIHDGEFTEALADIKVLESIDPAFNSGYVRGLIALDLGFPAEAQDLFSKFIAEFPNDSEARIHRARARRRLHNNREALADLLVAVEYQDPFSPGLILETATLADQLQDPELALSLIGEAIAQRGIIAQLQIAAVDLLSSRQRYDEAIGQLRVLLETSDNPEWRVYCARLLLKARKPGEAEIELKKARAQLKIRKPTPWQKAVTGEIVELEQQLASCKGPFNCPAPLQQGNESELNEN